MTSLFALVVMARHMVSAWDTVDLPSQRWSDAIELGIASRPTRKDYPQKDPLVRSWEAGDSGLTVRITCAMPPQYDDEGDEITTGKDQVTKTINNDFKSFNTGGAKTMTLDRSGIKIKLTVGTDIYGNLRLTESSQSPVLYVRSITARPDRIEDAMDILKGNSIRTEGDPIRVYANGFPKGWTNEFGDGKIEIPIPQDHEAVDSKLGKVNVKQWGNDDSYWYWTDFFTQYQGSPEDLAKQPFPYEGALDNNTIVNRTDAVTEDGKELLRVFGTTGTGDYMKEWVAWYTRSGSGYLDAVLAVRKKGKPWPKDLPFSPTSAGHPVTSETFGEIVGWKTRTLKSGDAFITADIYGQTKRIEDGWIDYLRDGDNCIIQAYTGSAAQKKWESFTPANGKWKPNAFEKAENLIDISVKKFGDTDWYVVRLVGKLADGRKGIQRIELVHTKVKGESFLVWLVGIDKDYNREMSKRMLMSMKDADGKALLENYPPEAKSEYFLPNHQLRFNMTNLTPRATAVDDLFVFRHQGWTLSDGETTVYFSHDGNKKDRDPWHREFAEKENLAKSSKFKQFNIEAFGQPALVHESDWEKEGVKYTLTSVSHMPGAAVHFLRKVGSSDKAWKEFVSKTWQ